MNPHRPLGLFIDLQLYYQEFRADTGNCILTNLQTASNNTPSQATKFIRNSSGLIYKLSNGSINSFQLSNVELWSTDTLSPLLTKKVGVAQTDLVAAYRMGVRASM